jgi:hypothetical protein
LLPRLEHGLTQGAPLLLQLAGLEAWLRAQEVEERVTSQVAAACTSTTSASYPSSPTNVAPLLSQVACSIHAS